MPDRTRFYIDGAWVAPAEANPFPVIDPADETAFDTVSLGARADVDRAVAAANSAFAGWSITSKDERLACLRRLVAAYEARLDEMAATISREMGAPMKLARAAQAPAGLGNLKAIVRALEEMEPEQPFRADKPEHRIALEPVGVAALITPWNWPMNQVTLKVGAALAAGCTMVLKPSEIAPLSAMLFAEMVDEAGFPAGVFNLVNGDGAGVGTLLSSHPGIDMVSFTGSTRAGILVSRAAADTVKRVALELGGKGPNLIFADAEIDRAAASGARGVFNNSGQSCNAPTRMLVERSVYDRVVEVAAETARNTRVGPPGEEGDHIGPVVSEAQFEKIQGLIEKGIAEGARLVAGGPGRPEGFNRGYYVRPTVFADVDNSMTIAREEIFGPVLSILPFGDEDEAVEIANDTPYGLTAYLQTGDADRARRVARRLRSGMVQINGAARMPGLPFGGMKQSGNGREGGRWGIEEFLEVKAISGWPA